MGVARATWVWLHPDRPLDLDALVAHLTAERVDEVFVSVPWSGPDARVRACVAALRRLGLRVAALGGEPGWADADAEAGDVEAADAEAGDAPAGAAHAVAWARRATAEGLFDAVHLDVEPWTRTDWPGREGALLLGLERAVRQVAAATALPVEVDLVPWLAVEHPRSFEGVARSADAVTLMAYRDRAAAVLAASAGARAALAGLGRPWRIAVDTLPSASPDETFADDGRAVLDAELAAIVAALRGADGWSGVAVHDAEHWRALP
ncbi:hypothetical protein OVA14_07600 [Agrococcus sp. SL85]|uniref:hypothetical protein n=1 Tax=Agrococcus sp. SL85 TaxID=2995141 RepID=UPI00226C896C|nr:hypothetical protein [Agrococcus sp. SL85]WAC65252.1 hypothetical protein OVA14_07600 [Agrococcus sp. SL85]